VLLGLSVLLGVARAFQMPAQQALTPSLVPARMLARAMAFSSGGMQAATILGPALAGLLYAAGAPVVYGSALVLDLLALVCMFVVHLRYQQAMQHEPISFSNALAGVRFIAGQPVILGALSLDLFAVLLGGAVALLPVYARDILHTGPLGLGCLRSAPAFGALVMSLYLTRWPLSHRVGATLLWSVGVYGLATVVFGLSHSLFLSLLVLAISGAADMVSVVIRQTLVQVQTPEAMRGRVSAVNAVFIGASNQLGEFESGATAAWWGPVGAVVVGGVGTLLIAVSWFRLFPALARRDTLAG
jgi:MFS family permease